MWSSSQLIRSSICSSPYLRLLGQCGGGGVMLAIAVDRDGVLDSPVEQVTRTSSKQEALRWHMQGCIPCAFTATGSPLLSCVQYKNSSFSWENVCAKAYNRCTFRRSEENQKGQHQPQIKTNAFFCAQTTQQNLHVLHKWHITLGTGTDRRRRVCRRCCCSSCPGTGSPAGPF